MSQLVPLTSQPNQTINTVLSINGQNRALQLGFRFNEMAGYWIMVVSDSNTQSILIDSLPLVTGLFPAANLLGQYAYLGIGAATLVNAGNVAMDYPGSNNLGTDFVLIWGDNV